MGKTEEELEQKKQKDLEDQERQRKEREEKEKGGKPKLFLGKFKNEEEAGKALTNLERRLGEMAEDNKFLQEQLEGKGTKETAREPSGEEDDEAYSLTEDEKKDLYEKPDKVFKNFGKRMFKKWDEVQQGRGVRFAAQREYETALHGTFYKDNPDLAGYERIVGVIGAEIQRENPRTPPHRLLGQIAERSKAYIDEIRSGKGGSRATTSEDGDTRGGAPPKKSESAKELDKTIAFQRGLSTG